MQVLFSNVPFSLPPITFAPDGKTPATCSIRSADSSEIFLWHTAEDETAAAAQGQDPSTNPAH